MEDRKLKEIEHSRKRRSILQGFERIADTNDNSQVENLAELVSSNSDFEYHFSNMKYYSVTKSSEEYKHKWLQDNLKFHNQKLLDFACGSGENGIYGAQIGYAVDAIDISPEGIENCKKNAFSMSVSENTNFEVMDGEKMSFPDDYFDTGIEYGALHHVDLPIALKELARVLKPDAKMLCIEALRHNPIIHAYRKRTPHLRTEWEVEHILGVESLKIMKDYFSEVNVRFFHLTSLALVPIRKTPAFNFILPILDRIDSILLSNQFIGKYAWIMAVELSNPKK
ncbi:S-adenosyl-L-methionine-dependent methyltransferase [Synechococcus sp. BOUM118]|nr:S-adenosyl-L-methionine-dependent methyltransferase [Synechococcus sp. BOUM118]